MIDTHPNTQAGRATALAAVNGDQSRLWYDGRVIRILPPLPVPVPQTLSSRQFWLAIDDAGLTAAVNAAVAAAPLRVQIEVREATEFRRDYPLLIAMAAAIGKTAGDLDQVFIHGDTL